LPQGEQPETKHVRGSNYCDIAVVLDERTQRVVITSVIDNMLKGAAGQAIHNLNLRRGYPATTGLQLIALP
ncbi:MAG: N-acetyl-gamma-glutamyl-phosphate reductase, partial [Vampirovibrionales bacterium]